MVYTLSRINFRTQEEVFLRLKKLLQEFEDIDDTISTFIKNIQKESRLNMGSFFSPKYVIDLSKVNKTKMHQLMINFDKLLSLEEEIRLLLRRQVPIFKDEKNMDKIKIAFTELYKTIKSARNDVDLLHDFISEGPEKLETELYELDEKLEHIRVFIKSIEHYERTLKDKSARLKAIQATQSTITNPFYKYETKEGKNFQKDLETYSSYKDRINTLTNLILTSDTYNYQYHGPIFNHFHARVTDNLRLIYRLENKTIIWERVMLHDEMTRNNYELMRRPIL